jgi:hypothetical protein
MNARRETRRLSCSNRSDESRRGLSVQTEAAEERLRSQLQRPGTIAPGKAFRIAWLAAPRGAKLDEIVNRN